MDLSRVGRGVAIMAIAALAVAVVSPAFSAAPLTKAKVIKIAKKVANKQINAKSRVWSRGSATPAISTWVRTSPSVS
jgi:hypothetical protein